MDWQSTDIANKYRAAEVITGPFAHHLVKQCELDRADGSQKLVILDNACGTGVVTYNIYNTLSPAAKEKLEIVCGDFSPGMVKSVQERIELSGWQGATAKVIDAQKADLPNDHFTHVLTSFALVGVPRPRDLLSEAFRILQPGGTLGITIWKFTGWFPLAIDAVASIPGAPPPPSYQEFCNVFLESPGEDRWVDPAFFEDEIRKAGFEDVKVALHTNETRDESVEKYLETYAGVTSTLLGNIWNEEQRAKFMPPFGAAVKEVMKAKFGDGEVVLGWEAYCVTAKVPSSKP